MRQLFTSPRLENVEVVAKLLADAGIEHKVTGGRSYKAHSRREFSYSGKSPDDAAEQPAVWIIKSEDYKPARELMHALGLLESTQAPSYLPEALQFVEKGAENTQARLLKIRVALLFVLIAIAAGMALRMLFFR